MYSKFFHKWLVLFLIIIIAVHGFSQYNFKAYTLDDGLHQSQVYSVCQDSRGNLWVGTYGGGVSKYDGKTFRQYTTKHGLKNNIVYAILEDRAGNLWFGTDGGGVCKYDGVNFTCITEEDGLPNNHVYAIEEDISGNLWFGTFGGGIALYNPNKQAKNAIFTIDTASGLLSNQVHSILEDSRGNLWFGTEAGANMLDADWIKKDSLGAMAEINEKPVLKNFVAKNQDKNKNTSADMVAELGHNVVYSIIEDRNGNILFGTFGGGISVFTNDKKWKYVTAENGLCDNEITTLFEDNTGNIWVGTYGQGICKILDGINFTSHMKFDHLDENEGLSSNIIWSISEDQSGNLWMGTEGGGLIKYLGETFTHYTTDNGLKSNIVFSVLEDKKGNIWLGTNDAWLTRLASAEMTQHISDAISTEHINFTNFSTKHALENDMVITLLEDKKERIWIGTNKGVCLYENNDGKEKISHFNAIPQLNNNVILTTYEDTKGNLWFGTDGNGVIKFHPDSFYSDRPGNRTIKSFTTNEGLNNNTIWAVHEDRYGSIWLGTWGGGVSRLVPSGNDSIPYTISNITEENGLSGKFVLSILEGPMGNMWFGTYGEGISILASDDFHTKSNFTNISQIRKTQSKFQASKQEKYKWSYISTANGLSDDGIVSMAFDAIGNIWIGTNTGINKVSNITQGMQNPNLFHIQQYGKLEGFTGIEGNQNAICRDSRGSIWFGTANYLTRYNAWADEPNSREPKTSITGLRLFFEDADWIQHADSVTLWNHLPVNLKAPYNKNHLTFDFIGISMKIPEKVRYQYMLEGLDQDWSPPVKETFATYPQLPPGKYTFMVKACNNDGVWNKDPTMFTFVITPPFWQTWWFYLLCAVALILAVYATVMYRIRSLQRAKILLKEQVKLRTHQLRKEKILVEKQKTELEIAYNKLKDLENFKRSLMGMIVHDLKNPLNSILSFSRYEPAKDVLQNIYRAGKQMLNLVMNILDVQKFEDTEIKLNLQNLQVLALAHEMVKQVVHLAEEKEISVAYDIAPGIFIKADEEITVRIVVNLLTNAIKYTPTRGKITISAEIPIAIGTEKDMVQISVTDTGIGIVKEKQHQIFERFAQIESKDSGQVASTGLGLTFCKMAVEAHGGEINIHSQVNIGTTFYFTLPKGEKTEEVKMAAETENLTETSDSLNLIDSEKEVLRPLLEQFGQITVYHTTENITMLKSINSDSSLAVNKWKEEMESAIYNCNENKYTELLNMLK